MKRIIFFLAILLFATRAQGSELIGQLDSIIHHSYNANTGTLKFESKSEFQYGQDKNPETPEVIVKYSWNNDQQSWIADSGFVCAYDKNEKEISCEARFYDTGKPAQLAWTLATKTEYEYEEDENKTLKTIYSWDENTSDWIQTKKEEYYYTMDFKDSLVLTFFWDQSQEDWLNYQKSESDYDSFGNKILVVNYDWNEEGVVWTVKSKNEYTCDENGNTIVQLIYKPDEGTGEMNLYMSKEYEFDLSNSKAWDSYTIGHQNKLSTISTMLDSGNETMLLSSTDTLYYSTTQIIISGTETLSISEDKIYPNPVINCLYVNVLYGSSVNYQICDFYGRRIISGNLLDPVIDVSGLLKGIYFLKMNDGNTRTVKRFLKQ